MICGYCTRKILFFQRKERFAFMGYIHVKCKKIFMEYSVLRKLKGMALKHEGRSTHE